MSTATFKDHFSGHADDYRRFRPSYPDGLFERLLAEAPLGGAIWDCATGNGQAAEALARLDPAGRRVIAGDPSQRQIAEAVTRAHSVDWEKSRAVHYAVFPAEAPPLATNSVALITVAQALHWFDHPRFFSQARRVCRPGALIAVWCYELMRIEPEIDRVIDHFYTQIVGPYWPPERRLLEDRYQTIAFPFDEFEPVADGAPPTWPPSMTARWSLDHLIGYLGTWSASRRYLDDQGTDPRNEIVPRLLARWGDPDLERTVDWPLALRLGRVV